MRRRHYNIKQTFPKSITLKTLHHTSACQVPWDQNGVDSLKGAVKEGPLNKEGPSERMEVSSKMDIVNVEKALSSSNM